MTLEDPPTPHTHSWVNSMPIIRALIMLLPSVSSPLKPQSLALAPATALIPLQSPILVWDVASVLVSLFASRPLQQNTLSVPQNAFLMVLVAMPSPGEHPR